MDNGSGFIAFLGIIFGGAISASLILAAILNARKRDDRRTSRYGVGGARQGIGLRIEEE